MTEPTRNLVRELIGLRTSNRTARVEICTGNLTTTLVIAGGDVVEVMASKPGEPLGRILTQKRLLTQDQYVDVLERMSSALALGERIRFGEIAVELGYVDEVAVRKCLSEQQRSLASRVFLGASPTWTVHEATAASDASPDASMRVEALFLYAVRWTDDARKGALGLDDARGEPVGAAWEFDVIDARFGLTDAEADFVRSALTDGKTLAELIDGKVPSEDVDSHAILTALIASGAAAPLAPGKPARTPSAPPARVRAVPRPLRAWAIDGARAKSALEKVRLAKNRAAGSPPNEAERLVEVQLRSEQAFQRGKEQLQREGPTAALADLERALELRPDCAEYELFVKWARQANQADGLGAASRAELERLAKAALRDNAKLAFGYFVLGEVLREQGDLEEARRQLRYALRFEPELFAAIRAQRRGGSRGSSPSLADVSTPDRADSSTQAKDSAAEAAPVDAPAFEAAPADAPAAEPAPAAGLEEEPQPKLETKPDADRKPATDPEPAPAVAADEPAAATAPSSRTSRATLLLAAGGVAVVAAVAFVALGSGGGPGSTPTPPATPTAVVVPPAPSGSPAPSSSVVGLTPTSSSDVGATALAPSSSAATPSPVASGAGPTLAVSAGADAGGAEAGSAAADSTRGDLVLGPKAVGHRVFVDGRVVASTGARVSVPCGRHEVRVGSHGKSVPLDVPCGGERAVP